MRTHDLKIRGHWMDRIESGEKRAEIRKHDRDFQVGDVLHLTEVSEHGYPVTYPVDADDETPEPDRGHRVLDVRVVHVLDGRLADGIDDGYCLLSIAPVRDILRDALFGGAR